MMSYFEVSVVPRWPNDQILDLLMINSLYRNTISWERMW